MNWSFLCLVNVWRKNRKEWFLFGAFPQVEIFINGRKSPKNLLDFRFLKLKIGCRPKTGNSFIFSHGALNKRNDPTTRQITKAFVLSFLCTGRFWNKWLLSGSKHHHNLLVFRQNVELLKGNHWRVSFSHFVVNILDFSIVGWKVFAKFIPFSRSEIMRVMREMNNEDFGDKNKQRKTQQRAPPFCLFTFLREQTPSPCWILKAALWLVNSYYQIVVWLVVSAGEIHTPPLVVERLK